MRKIVLFLLAVAAPGWLAFSAPVSGDAFGSVTYEVRFQSKGLDTKVADATVSFEKAEWNQQKVHHAHAVIRASSIFRLFMKAEYLADAYLAPDGGRPLYYMNPVYRAGKVGKFECVYDHGAGTVTSVFLRPPADAVETVIPMDVQTMDLLSLMQYVRFLELPAGCTLPMQVLKEGRSLPATLTSQGADSERYPGVTAERFLLSLTEGGLMENGSGNRISVWRSGGTDRKLLGLEVNLGSGVMVVSVKQ